MRILIVSNLYPPNVVGGYERLCFEVTGGLAASGHDMVVLTSRYGGKVADYAGQRILRELKLLIGKDIYTPFPGTADDRASINAANRETLLRVLGEERPDVVFAWNLFFLDASLLDVLEQSGIRTVVMLTDNWLLVMRNPLYVHTYFKNVVFGSEPPPAPLSPAPAARLFQRLRRMIIQASDDPKLSTGRLEAIFGSAFMRDYYAAGGAHFVRHKIVHNGVKQGQYAGAPLPDRSRLVEHGTLRLLFAGRLVDLKGAHIAVAMLPLLDAAALGVSRVTLTLLGDAQDSAYMAQLEKAIEASGLRQDIELRQSVAEDALPALFESHDLYLFPSLYEPFSLTLIHALALGIPTIASDIGGNTEIVQDGESGMLFRKGDPADMAAAVTRLTTDAALRKRVAEGGRMAAARFTFERMVADMSAFLSSPA